MADGIVLERPPNIREQLGRQAQLVQAMKYQVMIPSFHMRAVAAFSLVTHSNAVFQ